MPCHLHHKPWIYLCEILQMIVLFALISSSSSSYPYSTRNLSKNNNDPSTSQIRPSKSVNRNKFYNNENYPRLLKSQMNENKEKSTVKNSNKHRESDSNLHISNTTSTTVSISNSNSDYEGGNSNDSESVNSQKNANISTNSIDNDFSLLDEEMNVEFETNNEQTVHQEDSNHNNEISKNYDWREQDLGTKKSFWGKLSSFLHFKKSSHEKYDQVDADQDDFLLNVKNVTMPSHSNDSSTPWYTLSHYISPESTLYDTIEGFLIATLFCLIVATCYNFIYYICLVRCCRICPDERVYSSLLYNRRRRHRKYHKLDENRRKRRKRGIPRNILLSGDTNEGRSIFYLLRHCCICYCIRDFVTRRKGLVDNHDGKGLFTQIRAFNDTDSSDMDDNDDIEMKNMDDRNHDEMSLSSVSVLSLEYGDDQLHDEYGEITNRMKEQHISKAAHDYFQREEQICDNLSIVESTRSKRSKRRNKTSVKSIGSRHSYANKSIKSQVSSILSSSSDSGFDDSHDGSSSDDGNHLEMDEAMLELQAVQHNVDGYVGV